LYDFFNQIYFELHILIVFISKIAPPYRIVEFDILFGVGIDKYGCLLDAAETVGIVQRKGSWYNRGEFRIAQGRRPATDFLKNNLEIAAEIESELREYIINKSNVEADSLSLFEPYEEEESEEDLFDS
jgi:recombination protein RecA